MTGPPLRVGMVSLGLPQSGVKSGGVDRVAHDLAEGLARRGHDVVVWTHSPPPAGVGYQVRRLPGWRRAHARPWKWLMGGCLANLVQVMPDFADRQVLIAHGDSLLMGLTGRPHLRVVHGSGLGEALRATSAFRRILMGTVYAQELLATLFARYSVGVSRNTCRHLPFTRAVITNGVDLRRFTPFGPPADHPTVLFVGAIGGRKRGALLVDWFRTHVRAAVPSARLDMVVDRPGPAEPGVTYHVGLTDPDLVALYRRAWVYASPSSYEGFGLPYLEAMACGVAVVATPNPGSREVLDHGRYGVLADDDRFPGALVELLQNPIRRAELVAAGAERAAELSLDEMIARYVRVLRRAVAGRPVPRDLRA